MTAIKSELSATFDVFVAHAGEDQDVALSVRDALVETGRSVFVYQQNLMAQPHFVTTSQILSNGWPIVVLVASHAAARSEHVRREIELAEFRGLDILYVFRDLDPTRLSGDVISALLVRGQNGTVIDGQLRPEQLSHIVDMVEAVPPHPTSATSRSHEVVIGRELDLERIVGYLKSGERRIINVHGAPGAGKSTVARAAGDAARDRWLVDDVTIVALEQAHHSPDEIAQLVASALDLDTDERAVIDAVGDELAQLGRLLLRIENIEFVNRRTEQMMLDWVSRAPDLRILSTSSRSFLTPSRLVCDYPLAPLSLPSGDVETADPAELIQSSAAVQMFLSLLPDEEVAGRPRVRRALAHDAAIIRQIASLCTVLGGFPQPIQLAAKAFENKGQDLAKLIKNYEGFLVDHYDDPGGRRYMFAATETQLGLLPAHARLGFLQCAQFDGPISDAAAASILLIDDARRSAISILDQLTEYHLLEYDDVSDRYTLSLPIKQYGRYVWEEQTSQDQRETHEERFVDYFAALASTAIDHDADDSDRNEAVEAVDLERRNLLQAASRLVRGDERLADLALAVAPSLFVHGPVHELIELVSHALEVISAAPSERRVELLTVQAEAAWAIGDYEAAVELSETSAEVARDVGNDRVEALALVELGKNLGYVREDAQRRVPVLREAVDRLEPYEEEPEHLIHALLSLAAPLEHCGEIEEAQRVLDRAREVVGERLAENDYLRGRVENVQGLLWWHDGRPSEALDAFVAAEHLFKACDSERWWAGAMTNRVFALCDVGQDRLDDALALCEAAHVHHLHARNRGWMFVNTAAKARALLLARRRTEAIDTVHRARRERAGDDYATNRALLTCVLGEALWEERDERAGDTLSEAIEALGSAEGARLLRRFRVGVAYAELLHAAGDRAGARAQLDAVKTVKGLRRISSRHPVWHIRDVHTRYLELMDELRGSED